MTVTLCLSCSLGLLSWRPRAHSARCWLSLLHLISNWSATGPQTQSGFPRAPSAGCGFAYHISSISVRSPWNSNSTVLYSIRRPYISFKLPRGDMDTRRYGYASTPPQFLPISGDRDVSLPLSLEWPVWSSSSGNNCYAVHRSLSSGASVYECTMGIFYLVPFHQPISAHAISSHNCHGNVSLPSGASPWMAFWAGSKGQNITQDNWTNLLAQTIGCIKIFKSVKHVKILFSGFASKEVLLKEIFINLIFFFSLI